MLPITEMQPQCFPDICFIPTMMSTQVPTGSSLSGLSFNALFLSFFFFFLKTYLFLDVLGLRCCVQALSSCSKWRLLSSCGARGRLAETAFLQLWCERFSLRRLLLLQSTGSGTCRLLQLLCLVAPQHVESSQARGEGELDYTGSGSAC